MVDLNSRLSAVSTLFSVVPSHLEGHRSKVERHINIFRQALCDGILCSSTFKLLAAPLISSRFRRGFRRFDRRECSSSSNYHRRHCDEVIIWMNKEFYGGRRNISTLDDVFYDVRIQYHLLLDEFWSLMIVFRL